MKRSLFLVASALTISVGSHAQEPDTAWQAGAAELFQQETSDTGWTIHGENTFLINQSSFSNWAAGGINSLSANLVFNYDFNYSMDRWVWDNKLIAAYGLNKQQNIGWRKDDDRLILNSLLGYRASQHWMYTFYADFETQFAEGFMYNDDNEANLISDALAPARLRFGPGFAYRQSENFRFNLSPAASRFIFVTREELREAFDVDPNSSSRFEFGASFDAYYRANIMENVSLENILRLYSNYLEKPQNVDVDYTLNLYMKVNDYITVNGGVQLIYDDNIGIPREEGGVVIEGSERPALQVRQILGVGLTYQF